VNPLVQDFAGRHLLEQAYRNPEHKKPRVQRSL
jgi:hypothetical protein